MSQEVSKWLVSGLNLPINGVYWGYNPLTNLLLTSWDIQVVLPKTNGRTPQIPDSRWKEFIIFQSSKVPSFVRVKSRSFSALRTFFVDIQTCWCSSGGGGASTCFYKKMASSPAEYFQGGGFKHFWFSPLFEGEDEPILTSIFFKWVGSTTNYPPDV